MKHLLTLLLPLLTTLGLAASREDSPAPGAAAHPLAWMEGHWTGEGLGGTFEEVWLPPVNGAMVGTFRLIQNGKVAFYELITIQDQPSGLSMVLRHFHPDLKGWEEKDAPLVWKGEHVAEGQARFGPVAYEREGKDRMRIFVELGEGDATQVEELTCTRID